MKKEKNAVIKKIVIPEICNRGSSTHPPFRNTTTNDKRGRFPSPCRTGKLGNDANFMASCLVRCGFTLIELLVVVLIIGILAAVAVPQYQKAVDKAKYTQARTLAESLWQARQRYYLANGTWTTRFDELDIDVPEPNKVSNLGGYDQYDTSWGSCWLHPGGYVACTVRMGSGGARYFAYNGSQGRECWAEPKDNARANALCKSVTGKSGKNWFDQYTVYTF